MSQICRILLIAGVVFLASCRSGLWQKTENSPNSTIEIVLLDGQGLLGGERVYNRGVLIGVTRAPRLVQDRAVVTVQLRGAKADDIARCSVFTVDLDTASRSKLGLVGKGPSPGTSENFCLEHGFLGIRNETLDTIRNGGALASEAIGLINELKAKVGGQRDLNGRRR